MKIKIALFGALAVAAVVAFYVYRSPGAGRSAIAAAPSEASEPIFPEEVAGFNFRAQIADLQRACESALFEWRLVSTAESGHRVFICTGLPRPVGTLRGLSSVYADAKVESISLELDLAAGLADTDLHSLEQWGKLYRQVFDTLVAKYGTPNPDSPTLQAQDAACRALLAEGKPECASVKSVTEAYANRLIFTHWSVSGGSIQLIFETTPTGVANFLPGRREYGISVTYSPGPSNAAPGGL